MGGNIVSLIYMYTFPNGKIYIGKTKNSIESRAGSNGVRYGDNSLVGRAIRKYGWINVKKEILVDNITDEDANRIEREMIAKFNSTDRLIGYNLTRGGDGGAAVGHTFSEETKRKIGHSNSLALKGRKVPKEVRDKISKANTGRVVSEETRHKLSVANTGKHHSEETKKKICEKNCMKNPETIEKLKESLEKSQEIRTQKRLQTMRECYPDGFKQSEESNRKRSEALKGVPKSEETKQKMRKPKSPEAIENMRKAQIEAWKKRKEKTQLL